MRERKSKERVDRALVLYHMFFFLSLFLSLVMRFALHGV